MKPWALMMAPAGSAISLSTLPERNILQCDMYLKKSYVCVLNSSVCVLHSSLKRGEWSSGLNSFRQVKLGRVRSNSEWVTSEA